MKIEFHPEAYTEMLESARFYEERSEGFGADFLAALNETTHRIQQFPDAGAVERGGLRKRLSQAFLSRFCTNHIEIESILRQ